MKEVTLTLCDYSCSDGQNGIFGFIVFEVLVDGESFGLFATEARAQERINFLKKHFNLNFSVRPVQVLF